MAGCAGQVRSRQRLWPWLWLLSRWQGWGADRGDLPLGIADIRATGPSAHLEKKKQTQKQKKNDNKKTTQTHQKEEGSRRCQTKERQAHLQDSELAAGAAPQPHWARINPQAEKAEMAEMAETTIAACWQA